MSDILIIFAYQILDKIKNMIFYFSGTGNTRWAAEQISEAVGEELFFIPDMIKQGKYEFQLSEDERVGVCFPVHGWRPPFIVRDFVRRLKINKSSDTCPFVFAFATCGDDVGLTFKYIKEDFAEAGLSLDSSFSMIMPESYIFPVIDMIDKPEKAEEKKQQGKKSILEIIDHIKNEDRGQMMINNSHWPVTNSKLLGGFFLKYWVTDKKFRVDTDKCIHCGLCEKVCPVDNIEMQNRGDISGDADNMQPSWKHNGLCTTCFACYHHCPAHAIDFGSRTKGKRQYYFK